MYPFEYYPIFLSGTQWSSKSIFRWGQRVHRGPRVTNFIIFSMYYINFFSLKLFHFIRSSIGGYHLPPPFTKKTDWQTEQLVKYSISCKTHINHFYFHFYFHFILKIKPTHKYLSLKTWNSIPAFLHSSTMHTIKDCR